MCPDIDDLVVTFVVGDETHRVVVHHFLHLSVTLLDDGFLFRRDDDVTEVERQTATEGHVVTHVLDVVEELGGAGDTAFLDDLADDGAERLLGDKLVDVADFLGDELIEEHTAHGGVLDETLHGVALLVHIVDHHAHGSVEGHTTFVVGNLSLFGTVELQALTLGALAEFGDIVETKHHILGGDGDRRTVGGVEDVV